MGKHTDKGFKDAEVGTDVVSAGAEAGAEAGASCADASSAGTGVDATADTNAIPNELEHIIRLVKQDVIGQDEAVEQVCSLIDIGKKRLYAIENLDMDQSFIPQFCSGLLIGTSGSGKTYMLKNIAQHQDMIFWEIDATTLTGEGWKGTSLSTQWSLLSKRMAQEPSKMALVFIDEVDKILKTNDYYDNGSAKFDLLKPLEGGIWRASDESQSYEINFDRCVIILSGAFCDIEKFRTNKPIDTGFQRKQQNVSDERDPLTRQDLISWGAPRELVGRFSLILNLNELGISDYQEIINIQLLKKYSSLLPYFEIKIQNEAAQFLAEETMGKELGVRYVNQRINDLFMGKIWREVSANTQQGQIVTIKLADGDLTFSIRRCKPSEMNKAGASSQLPKRKDRKVSANRWACVIRKNIEAIESKKRNFVPKEELVENTFEYMCALKFDKDNTGEHIKEGTVFNDYSDAELDLLFFLFCALKYHFAIAHFTFENLKIVFKVCSVNYEGVSPLEFYFAHIDDQRGSRLVDKVEYLASTDSADANQAGAGRTSANSTGASRTGSSKNGITNGTTGKKPIFIREDKMMKKAFLEYMAFPQNERDEAVKMLAWRLI